MWSRAELETRLNALSNSIPANTTAQTTATPQVGVGGTQTTVAATPVESKGMCIELGVFFQGIFDSIVSTWVSFISKIKSVFVKAEEVAPQVTENTADIVRPPETITRVLPPEPQSLIDLRELQSIYTTSAFVDPTLLKNSVRRFFFTRLDQQTQTAVKLAMWNLAAPDEFADPQPTDRRPAPQWADRIIRGHVQLAAESSPRLDIEAHVNITANGSLFRQAINQVILQQIHEHHAAAAT